MKSWRLNCRRHGVWGQRGRGQRGGHGSNNQTMTSNKKKSHML